MEFQHLNVKLFLKNPAKINLEALVPVFHSWIQNQTGGELLLDVADYHHVPSGPGIVLIGHEANYSVDNADGRLGVRYNRKEPLEGSNFDRLVQATQAALTACQKLESDPTLDRAIEFNGRELAISINDRILAPNTPETFASAERELRDFLLALIGKAELTPTPSEDSRRVFSVDVKSARPFSTSELLASLSSLASAPK